jgi:molybdopterin converting factor subunit 1
MMIRVLFFGTTADEVGQRELELSLNQSPTVHDAFKETLKSFPNLEKHKLLFAVNQEYVSENRQLQTGDELAIFTAVSGG